MDFAQWLAANQYDEKALSETQRKHLEAAWKAETQPAKPEVKDAPPASGDGFDEQMAAIARENDRKDQIRKITVEACKSAGNKAKVDRLKLLCDSALEDSKKDVRTFQLEMLREERTLGPIMIAPQSQQPTEDVIEAAICVHHRLPGVEKAFGERTLESAHKQFRHGLSLKQLLRMSAKANGFRGDDADPFTLARYAMRNHGPAADFDLRADVGVSTGVQLPNLLGAVANKFIVPGFMFTEQSWRQIAKISNVTNFQQKNTYRATGATTYKKVSKAGEIKHGSVSELSYTDQADTYGILLGISREDMINDDLSAFTSLSQEIGRGAGEALNNIFWAEWLDDASFFTTGNANYDDGATDSVLSLAGLENANAIFMDQTKPDGTPLGSDARILLVPTALDGTARQLMQSETLNLATSTAATTGTANIYRGRFNPVTSRYLSKTSLPDGDGVSQTVTGSSTAWYLLADPNDLAAISVVFLFGRDMPTVESDSFEFNRLGIATRGYFDFGVNKHEYRAGVKLKGAA